MRRSHFLLGLCTRYSTTSARSIFLLLLYMLIYLAKLHGNYVVFCRRSTISSIYLIPFTVVTWHYPLRIPNSIFYGPCGKMELFPCLYHEACVLCMFSTLFSFRGAIGWYDNLRHLSEDNRFFIRISSTFGPNCIKKTRNDTNIHTAKEDEDKMHKITARRRRMIMGSWICLIVHSAQTCDKRNQNVGNAYASPG
jgi:hypothetical protein